MIPILIVVGFVILAMYFLLNKNSEEDEREGVVRDVLSKDALSVDFGDGRSVVVKLHGIGLASDSEMLDEKIYSFFDENVRGQRITVKPRVVQSAELMSAELYSMGGEYINAILVRHGFARWIVSEAPGDAALTEAQEKAKMEMLGVWNPAVRQLAEDKMKAESKEGMSDDEIANLSVDPSEEEEANKRNEA
ncbi:thermonuclease family protein [Pelagicoccus sp. SDUM812003]|uniref:thermonuclease family protein n=1 Tax=Pelagicoccus sp. SDUM812003 TaxID=3041267 RepID=UPI00280CF1B3|nr:thermonuclease family protein [Pelagicoccus sp. SDUM812003]MDQ8201385.1 thermonuclease family protein [Pelagicoccus sp. SDUM812003]